MVGFLEFVNHFLPFILTLFFVSAFIFFVIGRPYIRYIALVSNASNPEGVSKLARYLAHKTGGRRINVDEIWEQFIPIAEKLYKVHKTRQANSFFR